MKGLCCCLVLAAALAVPLHAAPPADPAQVEEIAKAQVFLDRAGFGPGKIDGRDGEFTRKALERYRRAQGQDVPGGETLDLSGLDLSAAEPAFITYTVTAEDMETVGELPRGVEAQGRLKWLPYTSAAEAVAEKFHCDVDFLEERNPGRTAKIQAGDQLSVPNVEPFELGALKPRDTPKESPAPTNTPPKFSVVVQTQDRMAEVYEGDRLIAAFPVTIGSGKNESPIGEWKVKGVAKLPDFRYDKSMLEEGRRSNDFVLLPPGPNNLVGVVWIALDRDGIGLHGSSEPDLIGRSQSHGCVRLANWDVARLSHFVQPGTSVSIQ